MSITYKDYNEKFRLPEQERDEKLIMTNKHYALCYAPGKGKSYPAIHCIIEVNKLKNGKANVLIMSDATCIKDMWKAEIVPQGILPKNTTIVSDRSAIGKIKAELLDTNWDMIVIDECQSLRSGVTRSKSQFAKLVYQLTKRTEYVVGMTGTISGNNDIEPFCVLHNLNVAGCGEISTRYFKKYCCENELQYGPFGSFERPTKLNERGRAIMNKAYEEGCSFWDYDENDNMPPQEIKIEKFKVPLTTSYKKALDGIFKCEEYETTFIKSIAIQKAQQALNGFIYYDNDEMKREVYTVTEYENPKLAYVIKACQDNKPKIVAYRFKEDGENIINSLTENKIDVSTEISEFKTKLENGIHSVLVLQCSRGKAANIQQCQDIIYYTEDFSFISYKQLIHRCWRRGQTEPCHITVLINEPDDNEHIELKIWNNIRQKQSIHDLLMSIKNKYSV